MRVRLMPGERDPRRSLPRRGVVSLTEPLIITASRTRFATLGSAQKGGDEHRGCQSTRPLGSFDSNDD